MACLNIFDSNKIFASWSDPFYFIFFSSLSRINADLEKVAQNYLKWEPNQLFRAMSNMHPTELSCFFFFFCCISQQFFDDKSLNCCEISPYFYSHSFLPYLTTRMFGSSMEVEEVVWVCVQIGDAISGGLLEIPISSGISVAAFKEKVKEEKTPDLDHVAANTLTVS
jgi:hypothetical protein